MTLGSADETARIAVSVYRAAQHEGACASEALRLFKTRSREKKKEYLLWPLLDAADSQRHSDLSIALRITGRPTLAWSIPVQVLHSIGLCSMPIGGDDIRPLYWADHLKSGGRCLDRTTKSTLMYNSLLFWWRVVHMNYSLQSVRSQSLAFETNTYIALLHT